MKTKIVKKWKVYLFSLGEISIDGAKVIGPRIGICSNNIKIKRSIIDANFKGCKPDEGQGSKPRLTGCAGSGGAHGG